MDSNNSVTSPEPKIRSLREAQSEISRELQVRERCYDRWVADGKMTDVDAIDRLNRHRAAAHYLQYVDEANALKDPLS